MVNCNLSFVYMPVSDWADPSMSPAYEYLRNQPAVRAIQRYTNERSVFLDGARRLHASCVRQALRAASARHITIFPAVPRR